MKSLIHKSKINYYSETINNNHKNPKQLWQNLHDVTSKSVSHSTNFVDDENGNSILDPEAIANWFNDHFTSVHKKVNSCQRGEPFDAQTLSDYVDQKIPEETKFSISPVKESFVLHQLQKLTVNNATGIDDISAKYLKLAAQVIANTLIKIFNLSIQN